MSILNNVPVMASKPVAKITTSSTKLFLEVDIPSLENSLRMPDCLD